MTGLGIARAACMVFSVADFDDDAIGCLSYRIAQRLVPNVGVHPDLTLIDDRFFVAEEVFGWVFDRQDKSVRLPLR